MSEVLIGVNSSVSNTRKRSKVYSTKEEMPKIIRKKERKKERKLFF